VSRYSSFYVVNNLIPIILSTCLGFFVFLLDGDDMEKRLSACPNPSCNSSCKSLKADASCKTKHSCLSQHRGLIAHLVCTCSSAGDVVPGADGAAVRHQHEPAQQQVRCVVSTF
jgi:hypothetical protein